MSRRIDRGTLRAAGFTALMCLVFLVVNASAAAAADGDGQEAGGLLAALNVDSAEGVPLDGYELGADGGSVVSFSSQIRTFLLGGLFTLVRLLVGLACWLIDFVFSFPLFTLLLEPAQTASEAYNEHVVGALGLKGLMLAWGFVFGLILFMRGKVGTGLGEILITLTLSALAASVFVRPDYLLAQDGPIDQTHQAAVEVARITVASHDFGGRSPDCSISRGAGNDPCEDTATSRTADVSRPLQDALTNALIIKPYQLLQYGRTLDPRAKADAEAYAAHLKWVAGGYEKNRPGAGPDQNNNCDRIIGSAQELCERDAAAAEQEDAQEDVCDMVPGRARDFCERDDGSTPPDPLEDTPGETVRDGLTEAFPPSEEEETFERFMQDLDQAGKTGKAAAAYAKDPTWDRVGGTLLLLIAVLLVVAIVGSMALVLLGTQAADLVAAACGGLAFVWGMLPGPSRQVVWKWLGIFMVSVLVMFAAAMFLPLLGIAIDAILTDGPDLMVERLLLIDALAVMGLAFHRHLLAGASTFGQRLATRMRYAKIGGTHLPGDTSELGAALGAHAERAGLEGISYAGGLVGARGLSRAHTALGLRHRMLGRIGGLADGTGMPAGASRLLADAGAEARRGLAPLGLAKDGVHGALLGAHGLLIGRRPDEEQLAKWRKPTVDEARERQLREGGGPGGEGPPLRGLGGNTGSDDGTIVNTATGEVLHDPENGRDLLSTRMHNKLVRFRGYRITRHAGRLAYGATYGLPRTVAGGRRGASRLTQDTRAQMRVSGQTLREDGQQWQAAAAAAREPVQRAAVAARVHGPEVARAARDTAAGAVLAASPSRTSPRHSAAPRPPVSATADVDAQQEARRRILDALMRAQRSTWDPRPRWGREDGEQQ